VPSTYLQRTRTDSRQPPWPGVGTAEANIGEFDDKAQRSGKTC